MLPIVFYVPWIFPETLKEFSKEGTIIGLKSLMNAESTICFERKKLSLDVVVVVEVIMTSQQLQNLF